MTSARATMRLPAIPNMSPAVDYRITYDGDVQRRTAGGEWETLTQRDISHAIAVQTRVGSFITGDLIRRVGESLYGDEWIGPMSRALDVPRELVTDWKRCRRVPDAAHLRRLHVIMSHRLPMMIQAADDLIDFI